LSFGENFFCLKRDISTVSISEQIVNCKTKVVQQQLPCFQQDKTASPFTFNTSLVF